jgi:hypothetical protein
MEHVWVAVSAVSWVVQWAVSMEGEWVDQKAELTAVERALKKGNPWGNARSLHWG